MNRIKRFLKRILFGEPLIMSVYKDEDGNIHGGIGKSYVDYTAHITNPKFLGKIEIY